MAEFVRFKKVGKWKELARALDPSRQRKALRQQLRRATALNGKVAEAAIRDGIKAGGFEGNRPLTVAIKSSTKPLADRGDLFQAATSKVVTSKVLDDFTVFAGILKSNENFPMAVALHDGASIKVTPAMRGLFYMLWLVSVGRLPPSKLNGRAAELWTRMPGGWLPLHPNTPAIVIPSRPFIDRISDDGKLRRKMEANWQAAIRQAIRESLR
jgi:hypothetical protein